MHIIETHGLKKRFGSTQALDGLDLGVREGEVHGFIGPNGSGKSTTIRILLGLVRADAGRSSVFGKDPWSDAVELHRHLAYVPGDVALWPGLTGGQCIDILARSHGGVREDRRRDLIERFRLDPTKRARDYSKGNRQKVSLVAALALDTPLLILDEPTAGLDPLMERVFQDCVRERAAEGCSVLLSSHILAEVEALADRVSIIREGRTVLQGTLDDLRTRARTVVHAITKRPPAIDGFPGVAGLSVEPGDGAVDVRCTVDPAHLEAVVGAVHGAGIHTLTVSPPTLDDLFLDAYENGET